MIAVLLRAAATRAPVVQGICVYRVCKGFSGLEVYKLVVCGSNTRSDLVLSHQSPHLLPNLRCKLH